MEQFSKADWQRHVRSHPHFYVSAPKRELRVGFVNSFLDAFSILGVVQKNEICVASYSSSLCISAELRGLPVSSKEKLVESLSCAIDDPLPPSYERSTLGIVLRPNFVLSHISLIDLVFQGRHIQWAVDSAERIIHTVHAATKTEGEALAFYTYPDATVIGDWKSLTKREVRDAVKYWKSDRLHPSLRLSQVQSAETKAENDALSVRVIRDTK